MGRLLAIIVGLTGCGRLGFGRSDGDAGDAAGARDDAGDPDGVTFGGDLSGDAMGMWAPMVPSPPTAVDLNAVWGFGANDVWVGGAAGTVFQFDGTTWTSRPGPTQNINMFWSTSATDLWEVGAVCEVRRWNGSTWVAVTVPTCANKSYFAVSGTSASDVWVAGQAGQLDHFDGATWTSLAQANNIDLWSVFAIGANDVYVTGTKGTILHWNGTSVVDESLGQNIIVASVWAASTDDVWAVGASGGVYHKQAGGAWTQIPIGTANTLYMVKGTSASNIWAVGDFATVLYYDGGQWSIVPPPAPTMVSLLAIAAVPGAGMRMAGTKGTVLRNP